MLFRSNVVKQVIGSLDDVVDAAVNKIVNPERWAKEFEKQVEKAGI